MKKRINIAIDGPSGVGKTVMATMLAKKLNYKFLSSGSFYRIIAFNALKQNIDLADEKAVNNAWNFEDIEIFEDGTLLFKNEDVTKLIREDKVSQGASIIAKYASIRHKVNQFIQSYSKIKKGIIVDGRDATYRILPNAEAKFFLWASPEERTHRRMKQNQELGIDSNETFEEMLNSIKQRDYNDMNRDIDPLKVSEGSIEIDTTGMSIEENFEAIYKYVKEKLI
ncbi:(d)CMP kinase [[Mycoplasma] anseris]|uniref:Cytidylate kinase n=1 Tax=[Mycoplasma] anseris TaxID=92400 RepID=A0A2Z4NCA0_9BACT|nr:(d)CMP kinase [[Mycoplasma] anseris]AWX69172.1 (d)CMP kinase [[Mycoplasma] anseris]